MTPILILFSLFGAQMLFDSIWGDDASSSDQDDDTYSTQNPPAALDPEIQELDFIPKTEGAVPYHRSGDGDAFNIDILFDGAWSKDEQEAVITSAEFISDLILVDQPDDTARGIPIDDLLIRISKDSVDGPSNILAYAQVNDVRSDTLLPTEATLVFDTPDVARLMDQGEWDSTVLHEMIHALGFGVFWSQQGLEDDTNPKAGARFTGQNARAEYESKFSDAHAEDPYETLGVPLDDNGHHWDEVTFGEEFMTPYLNEDSYVTDMTIAALEDMGYDTVYDDATRNNDRVGRVPTIFA